jgi:hypothetical protein
MGQVEGRAKGGPTEALREGHHGKGQHLHTPEGRAVLPCMHRYRDGVDEIGRRWKERDDQGEDRNNYISFGVDWQI